MARRTPAPRDRAAAIADLVRQRADDVVEAVNSELRRRRTVGGRVGSGLGSYLESLWGFEMGDELEAATGETVALEWIASHGYNDFAVVDADALSGWDPAGRSGELLRIEVKSMALDADESKAHFDALVGEMGRNDLLVVLLWRWQAAHGRPGRVRPFIDGVWVGNARNIAALRDELHIGRGGRFVDGDCPDCPPGGCSHDGEPLNAKGTRERSSGPPSARTTAVPFAGNFGGLVRMTKTTGDNRRTLARAVTGDPVARSYIDFLHTHLPEEERRTFTLEQWRAVAGSAAPYGGGGSAHEDPVAAARLVPGYRDAIWALAAA